MWASKVMQLFGLVMNGVQIVQAFHADLPGAEKKQLVLSMVANGVAGTNVIAGKPLLDDTTLAVASQLVDSIVATHKLAQDIHDKAAAPPA